MPVRKIPVTWNIGIGGAGVSIFYTIDSVDVTPALGTFFNAVKGLFPPAVTWQVPNAGDTLDIASGKIVGGWSGGTSATIAGTSAAPYVAGTGAYVRWLTSGVINGRRVKGRTFLCPLNNGLFDANGTIVDTSVTTMQTAVNALAGTGMLNVYSRPHPKGALNGQLSLVSAGVVPDKVTSIHSRRS